MMIKSMAKVFSHGLMAIVMKEVSKMICFMVMEYLNLLMATNTLVNFNLVKRMAKVFIHGLMAIVM